MAFLAGWLIRERRANRAHSNLKGEIQTIRNELQRIAEAGNSSNKRVTAIGDAVIAAINTIKPRLDHLQNRTEELAGRADENDRRAEEFRASPERNFRKSAEIAADLSVLRTQLAAMTERFSQDQKIMEERISEESRVHHERASFILTNLEPLKDHIKNLLERVDVLVQGYAESSNSVKSLTQSVDAVTTDAACTERTVRQLKEQEASIDSNLADLQTRMTAAESSLTELSSARNEENHPDQPILGAVIPSGPFNQTCSTNGEAIISSEAVDVSPDLSSLPQNEQTESEARAPRISPEKRGGHPRESAQTKVDEKPDKRPSYPKPHLIAQRGIGDWQIFIDAEHATSTDLRIVQSGAALLNEINGAELAIFGPLHNLTTPLEIFCNGSPPIEQTLITKENPALIFRVIQEDFAQSVRYPSRGLNLAVVPTDWRYNAERSGLPMIEPEPFGISGYMVHYYSTDHSTVLAFDRPDNEPYELHAAKSRFRLEGRQLKDAELRMGPLFIGDPPMLEADRDALRLVRTIVIGDEGYGTGKWRSAFDLNGISGDNWPMPAGIRNQGSGWYFVRLYDADGDLIDSLHFRYISSLRNIEINSLRGQGVDDHISATFTHDGNISVRPSSAFSALVGEPAASERGLTTFVWPYDASVREVGFEVESHGKVVRVTVEADRIWWARVDPPRQSAPIWRATTMEFTPDDFAPVSNVELWIRVPRLAAPTAYLGFNSNDRRKIVIAKSDGTVIVRLHEYSEAPELMRLGTHALQLWIPGSKLESLTEIAKVTVFKKCPWCDKYGAEPAELVTHLLDEHHDELFERLVLRGEGVSNSTDRKSRIVCLECGESYPESGLREENPITLLGVHSNYRHVGRMSYKKVDSPHELPGGQEKWIWKCKLDPAHAIIPPPADENALSDKKAHLMEEHLFDLFH